MRSPSIRKGSTISLRRMADDTLDQIRRLVVDDPSYRRRMLSAADLPAFIAAVIEVARECGIALSAEDVTDGLSAARRRHLERWV